MRTPIFLATCGRTDEPAVRRKDVSVNVEGRNAMAVPGHASWSTPIGVEMRSLISEAGEVTRDRRPRQKNKSVVFRRSSAAYGEFSEIAVC